MHDQVEVVLGLELVHSVAAPAELGGLALERAQRHGVELGQQTLGELAVHACMRGAAEPGWTARRARRRRSAPARARTRRSALAAPGDVRCRRRCRRARGRRCAAARSPRRPAGCRRRARRTRDSSPRTLQAEAICPAGSDTRVPRDTASGAAHRRESRRASRGARDVLTSSVYASTKLGAVGGQHGPITTSIGSQSCGAPSAWIVPR